MPRRLSLVAAALIAAAGCDMLSSKPSKTSAKAEPPPAAGPVVPEGEQIAKVNQGVVSTTDMELAVQELKRFMQAYQQKWQPLPVEEKADALDLHDVMNNLIDSELKSQDARSRGLDHRTDVQRRFGYVQRGFYAQEWDRWQQERSVPTEDEIHQFYEQNKAGFIDPERIHVRQIVTDAPAQAEAVRAQAVQGGVFAQLAREQSVGPGKDKGGDVGWYLRAVDKERLRLLGEASEEGVFFPQLEPVAFSLEAQQVSQPVKGPDGKYYLVQVEERKTARQKTELDVHDAIKGLLTFQKIQEALNALREKSSAQIQRVPEHLTSVQQ